MATERTLSIIKPDAVRDGNIGNIIAIYEGAGFNVMNMQMMHLSQEQAQEFYAIHAERPFYNALVEFMISGPVVVLELEGDNAVLAHRDVMGATNPADAAEGTIRQLYGASIDNNAVHGSDSLDNAAIEINFFFAK